jgi:SAM-dependent methyltransferase
MANEGIKFAGYLKDNKLKIFRFAWYFLRSVVLRGLINTIRLGALDLRHEKRFGISTSALGEARASDYYHYQGAGYGIIIRMFSDLAPGREHFHFIDIGCGKGRAVIVAENAGFRRITGIELYEDLLRKAAENVKQYPARRSDSSITLLQVNALNFQYQDEPAIYFLFNPFSGVVLKEVLLKILQSTKSETYFIYMNPKYAAVFAELGLKKARVYKTRFYTEAIVYHLPQAI